MYYVIAYAVSHARTCMAASMYIMCPLRRHDELSRLAGY